MTKKGVLLINLGTPDDASPRAVYRYLTEFLNDPRVIDLPAPLRWILTNLFIVPLRHRKSTAAYQQIWTATGSPLLSNSNNLTQALAATLGEKYKVALAMRYGNPDIQSALKQLKACDEITVIPLFPQYSSAATGSAIEKFLIELKNQWNIPAIQIKNNFYANSGFISTYASVINKTIANKKIDHLLLSYHGLPERHINKSLCQANCSRINSCPAMNSSNAYCYRAQCYDTSRLIIQQLQLMPQQCSVAFQSRLGRTPWIKPYTDLVLPELRKQGIKNLAIVCPSFVADCLETLEEVNIRARLQWSSLGGEEFTFIPCLNDNPDWVTALGSIITQPDTH